MLRFETWPPEVGAVDWTEQARASLHEMQINGDLEGISNMGKMVGSLLDANVITEPLEDKGFKVQRIAVELTQGWRGSAESLAPFMQSVAAGAGVLAVGSRPFTRILGPETSEQISLSVQSR